MLPIRHPGVSATTTYARAAMDSSQLRAEVHHVALERNKAAAAVGAIARNCSGVGPLTLNP
jgi:hypothetical protein